MLNRAGRNGPLLLFAGVRVGFVAPPLAEAARPLLPSAVFVFTLGAFLTVDLASFRNELRERRFIALALLWTTFGVPLSMLVLIRALRVRAGADAADDAVHACAAGRQRGRDRGDAGSEPAGFSCRSTRSR